MSYLPFLLVIPVVVSLLLRLNTHLQTWAYFKQVEQKEVSSWRPSVSILVPVKGVDEGASINFSRLCEQDYSGDYEIIFALENESDPAVSVIKDLIQKYSEQSIKLVFSDPLGLSAVGKIKNLMAGDRHSEGEVIVLIDSDVRVEPDFLTQSVGFVETPEIGAAFAAPVAQGSEDWVAALHNIAVNASALNYASSAYQQKNESVVGSIIVTRRDVLETIVNLDAIADRIVGIDVSLERAIRQADYKITLLSQPARIHHSRDTFPKYWWQIHRWLVTIRHYVPVFPWIMILLGLPLWWAIAFVASSLILKAHVTFSLVLMAVVLLADVLSIAVINQRLVKDDKFNKFLWVALFGELVSLPIFIHSLFSSKVLWRGRWLSIAEVQGN